MADTAAWDMISGNTVPWVASEHPGGFTLALKWIDSKKKDVARGLEHFRRTGGHRAR